MSAAAMLLGAGLFGCAAIVAALRFGGAAVTRAEAELLSETTEALYVTNLIMKDEARPPVH